MKFGIIAAGEGSRLSSEGLRTAKPLVEVCGEPLIDRLIRIFSENGASEIVVICNDLTNQVSSHLSELTEKGLHGKPIPLRYVVKSTPSSMHSFWELSRLFDDEPFVVTTVDTIFDETEFSKYVSAFADGCSERDGLMGVTSYVDDEKPLYVKTDDDMRITGFLDKNDGECNFISAGIYGLTSRSLETLNRCVERGESRMRNFQRALIADGLNLKAHAFSKVIDIDHVSDIEKAEKMISK